MPLINGSKKLSKRVKTLLIFLLSWERILAKRDSVDLLVAVKTSVVLPEVDSADAADAAEDVVVPTPGELNKSQEEERKSQRDPERLQELIWETLVDLEVAAEVEAEAAAEAAAEVVAEAAVAEAEVAEVVEDKT